MGASPRHFFTRLAQLVERQTFNLVVEGSSPSSGDFYLNIIEYSNTYYISPSNIYV